MIEITRLPAQPVQMWSHGNDLSPGQCPGSPVSLCLGWSSWGHPGGQVTVQRSVINGEDQWADESHNWNGVDFKTLSSNGLAHCESGFVTWFAVVSLSTMCSLFNKRVYFC